MPIFNEFNITKTHHKTSPASVDGTSNTLMYGEKFPLLEPDGAVNYSGGDTHNDGDLVFDSTGDSTGHPVGSHWALSDGSVRLADASDSFVGGPGNGGTRVPEHKEWVIIAEMQHEAHSSEALLLGQSATEAGSRLFVGNLTMHSEASNAAPDVPEFVDEAVGRDASRQLGRFMRNVAENDMDLNEVDAGGQFYSRENAGSGDFGHGDLLFGTDSSPLSEDPGIAWVSGHGGTRGLSPTDGVLVFELATGGGFQGEFSLDVGPSGLGSSLLEFSVENHPNNPAARPGSSISHYDGIAFPNSQAFNEPAWFSGRPGEARVAVRDVSGDASAHADWLLV